MDWKTYEYLYFNPAFESVLGVPVVAGCADPRAWQETLHPDDRETLVADYTQSIEERGAWDAEYRLVRPDGSIAWVHARAFAIHNSAGEITRVGGIAEEITERRASSARQQTLSLELDHRVKNTLAQVVAIADQTLARSSKLEDFKQAFMGRVESMAHTHEALASNHWEGVSLEQIVHTSLDAIAGQGRCTVEGPPARLAARASSSLGLALHELGTNAAKYGALSMAKGRVVVVWSSDSTKGLRLTWTEEGGPPVAEPEHLHMGLRLIRGLIEHDLGGTVELRFEERGLVAVFELPAALAQGVSREPVSAGS